MGGIYINPATPRPMTNIGTLAPGGAFNIVSNSLASPTVVTTVAPHGLVTGDQIYWTSSTTSVPALTATPLNTVTYISATTFSLDGINCSTAGTAGAYTHAVLTIPLSPAAAPLVTCGRPHGLRVGDTVTFVGGDAVPDLDGVQTVTAIVSATSFRVLTSATPTTTAATVKGYFTKTTFYTDVMDRGAACGGGALVITSTISTATNTVTANIQGSVGGPGDPSTWVWFNIPYALTATPRTFVITALTITTTTAVTYLLQELVFWRYMRVAHSASTNISTVLTATYI